MQEDIKEEANVEGLEQGYVLCPSEKRFMLLTAVLKKNRNRKIIVFFSSFMSVKHHSDLLSCFDLSVTSIHDKQKQIKQTTTMSKFCNASSGILLCTDTAVKNLDIPSVDWIVQYDPTDLKEYILRVSKIACDHRLLILRPEEVSFLKYLKEVKMTVKEFDFSWNKVTNIQLELDKLISKNYFLNLSAREAFKAYVRMYDNHQLKEVFDIETLDFTKLANSYGLAVPPAVDLNADAGRLSKPIKRSTKSKDDKTTKRLKIYLKVGKRAKSSRLSSR